MTTLCKNIAYKNAATFRDAIQKSGGALNVLGKMGGAGGRRTLLQKGFLSPASIFLTVPAEEPEAVRS